MNDMPVSERGRAQDAEPFEAFVKRVTEPSYAALILAEVERLEAENALLRRACLMNGWPVLGGQDAG